MKFHNHHLSLDSVEENGTFTGIASDAGPNRNGYTYAADAFAASLAAHKARGTSPAMLLHHDLHKPIGRWMEIAATTSGLRVRGKIATDTAMGGEAYQLLKAGALRSLSTGCFHEERSSGERNGPPIVTKADLFEISLVSVPANPNARVISVNGIGSARDIEDIFLQAGASGRKAKAMGAAAWRSIQTNAGSEDAALSDILDRASAKLARFNRS